MQQDGFLGVAGEIEIGMASEIDGRSSIGGGGCLPSYGIFSKHVIDRDIEVAGKSFFARWGMIRKANGVIGKDFGFPNGLAEIFKSAVQMMPALVFGQLMDGAAEIELPIGDAVCVSSDRAAEMRIVLQPILFIFETNENVFQPTLAIRHTQAAQGRAERVDGGGDSGRMGQGDGHTGEGCMLKSDW